MTCTAVRESEELMKEKPTVIAVVNQKGGTAYGKLEIMQSSQP